MIRLARDFRLIPVVLIATICLFALKVSGLVFDGGYTLGERLQDRYKTGLTVTTADACLTIPRSSSRAGSTAAGTSDPRARLQGVLGGSDVQFQWECVSS